MSKPNKQLLFDSAAIPNKMIKDFKVGEKIDTYFKVISIDKKTKKDGNAFLALVLMDKTGKIPAKIWNNADQYFSLVEAGEVYRINGKINEFMDQKQLKVDGLRAVTPSDNDYNKEDFQEESKFDTQELFNWMITTLKGHIQTPPVLKLVDFFVEEYSEAYKDHYGAQKIHHAYLGGLLEHTFSMMELAIFCADHYNLDKELLLMGVLFHDLGKMYEFKISPTVEATLEGGLLGHLVIGTQKFLELKNRIPDFPEELSIKIQHLIVSHHGEKEFGSPEVPKIPEAFALHIIDLMDSKMQIVKETIEKSETKGLFSDYIHVLSRRLLIEKKGESGKS
jgi:3'-5' exoribonuclease